MIRAISYSSAACERAQQRRISESLFPDGMIAAALVIEFLEDKVAGHFSKFGQVDSVAASGSYS